MGPKDVGPWMLTPGRREGKRVRVIREAAENDVFLQWNSENAGAVRTTGSAAQKLEDRFGPTPRTVPANALPSRHLAAVDPGNYDVRTSEKRETSERHASSIHGDARPPTSSDDHARAAKRSPSRSRREARAEQDKEGSRHKQNDSGYQSVLTTPNASQAAADARISGTNLAESFLTSPLMKDFAAIRSNDFKACRKFLDQNLTILRGTKLLFLREAIHAQGNERTSYARACVQKSIILAECSEMTESGALDYMQALIDEDDKMIEDFLNEFDRVYDGVKFKAKPSSSGAGSTKEAVAPSGSSRHDRGGSQAVTAGTIAPPLTTEPQFPFAMSASTVQAMKDLHVGDERRARPSTTKDHQSYSVNPTRPKVDRHGTGQSGRDDILGVPLTSTLSVPSIGGPEKAQIQEVDAQTLDGRFYQRPDAKQFFKPGRVFAIIWHENAGESKGGESQEDPSYISKGLYGERIFSHKRRMVVVRQRQGYVWAIPVSTYGGRGIAYKKMGRDEIEAHTIVYMSSATPTRLEGEAGMTKKAIAVKMAPDQTLDPVSRLNFARVFTIVWNVKVMNVGMVTPDSMPLLQGYWKNEMDARMGSD